MFYEIVCDKDVLGHCIPCYWLNFRKKGKKKKCNALYVIAFLESND